MKKIIFTVRSFILVSLTCLSLAFAQAAPVGDGSTPAVSQKEFFEKLGGPTLVSLHLKNATLREAIAALAEQSKILLIPSDTGIDGEFWKQQKGLVTVNVDNVPFWKAVSALTPSDSILVWWMDSEQKVVLVRPEPYPRDINPPERKPEVQSGLFTVFANSLLDHTKRDSYWNFAGKPSVISEAMTTMSFSVFADPKLWGSNSGLWIIGGTYLFPKISEDTGKLLRDDDRNSEAIQNISFEGFSLSASLQPATANARFINVSGRIKLRVASQMAQWIVPLENGAAQADREFEISDVLIEKGQTKTIGMSVKVAPFGKDDSNFDVQLQVTKGRLTYLAALPISAVRLEDAAGKIISGNFSGADSLHWEGNYHLTTKPVVVPARLIISLPTKIEQVELPFEFHDLPLPPQSKN